MYTPGVMTLFAAMQGLPCDTKLNLTKTPCHIKDTDTKIGEIIGAQNVKLDKNPIQKKRRVKIEEGNYRYFEMESVRTSAPSCKRRGTPIEESFIRNYVKYPIFQLEYHSFNEQDPVQSTCQVQTMGVLPLVVEKFGQNREIILRE